MIKTLYHGSANIIEKPVYGYGKTYNDYGLGFYCTDSLEMAKEWGAAKDRSGTGWAFFYRIENLMCLTAFVLLAARLPKAANGKSSATFR